MFDDASGKVITRRMVGQPMAVLDVARELPRPLLAVYEAGPTGHGLVRRARADWIEMVWVPSGETSSFVIECAAARTCART